MIAQLRRSGSAFAIAAALAMLLATPAALDAQSGLSVPVTGTVVGGGTFSGILNITSFAVQGGQVVATGTLTGTLTDVNGVVTSIVTTITSVLTVTQATCDILNLTIGPISLNLLGLQVNVSQIVVTITAQSGPGNLLGNLLCSIANALNNPGQLANLLNQLLAAL